MRYVLLFILLWCSFTSQHADAQRQLERGLILNPFIGDAEAVEEGTTSWMHHWGGWLGFSRYAAVRDEDHLWLHQLGGFLELARFGTSSSLLITSQIEFIADPANEINFNPRSVFWEEGLLFTHQQDDVGLQVGLYHRCKHDTDNLRLGEERTLIFASITGRITIDRPAWNGALKTDLYTIRQDFRLPPETRGIGLDWNTLLASAEAVFRIEEPIGDGGWNLYGGGMAGLSVFSATDDFWEGLAQPADVRAAWGASGGISLRGERGELRFNLDYEYLPDTGMTPIPNSAHLVRFGLLAVDPFALR